MNNPDSQDCLTMTYRRAVRWRHLHSRALCVLGAVALFGFTLVDSAAADPSGFAATFKSRALGARSSNVLVDCNGNGTPDEDDIDNCNNDPACDDCNLNDVPDSCDILSAVSLDIDLDGVPDECVFYDGGGVDDGWGTSENWDDDEVPNNLDLVDDESVTVELGSIDVDVSVEVDTLRLLDGSTLSIAGTSGEDFEVEEMGGILLGSSTGALSQLLVGNDRRITASVGLMEIRNGGSYAAVSTARRSAAVVTSTLEVANVLISSRCTEPNPGAMLLSSQMETLVLGDLVIDATQACIPCGSCGLLSRATRGETPPVLHVLDEAALRIKGDLAIFGVGQLTHSSAVPIEIGGSFINENTCPECSLISGSIEFSSSLSGRAADGVPARFEVAGLDLGAIPDGFNANFSMSEIQIQDGVTLVFADDFSNSGSTAPEALYVDSLILEQDSTITLGDSSVYYNTLIDDGATVNLTGAGSLTHVVPVPDVPAVGTWGVVIMSLTLLTFATVLLRKLGVRRRTIADRLF